MVFRITTWNVNGIRNPFGYQPWRDQKTFAAMFDILEADIVVFQETKIQRKDLSDDMVLVPGWDCYWSLPKHKKGYSGVVIYTKQSKCAPIRAEEGITGILCPPSSSTSFFDRPEDEQIGGYPTDGQLASSAVDAVTIDSEGRCVILEFPAFVLLGVYSPAARDESRNDFRLGFLNLLDARVRNLIAMGKRVILTGDLNISKEPLDNANPDATMRKDGMTLEEYISTPSRRFFNHLLEGGKVVGNKDEGREQPVMWDICRGFHPIRPGMFTCWEQKVNARPGNHGSRIDYVLCDLSMKGWFLDSNIQEGLMGSDHCPVYAVINDKVAIDGADRYLLDCMNPEGVFSEGQRQREYSSQDMLPMSGKLIPEFDGRRSIREMFARKISNQNAPCQNDSSELSAQASSNTRSTAVESKNLVTAEGPTLLPTSTITSPNAPSTTGSVGKKHGRSDTGSIRTFKRSKSGSTTTVSTAPGKGQQSLKGFFKPKTATGDGGAIGTEEAGLLSTPTQETKASVQQLQPTAEFLQTSNGILDGQQPSVSLSDRSTYPAGQRPEIGVHGDEAMAVFPLSSAASATTIQSTVHDPIVSKESWSKLFAKPAPPRCEGHDEPCITLLTKKSGMNCGRSFWMCRRPLGPSGAKERNTQWRCQTFIWCSDWNSGNL